MENLSPRRILSTNNNYPVLDISIPSPKKIYLFIRPRTILLEAVKWMMIWWGL